jgi:hypothetical protein
MKTRLKIMVLTNEEIDKKNKETETKTFIIFSGLYSVE